MRIQSANAAWKLTGREVRAIRFLVHRIVAEVPAKLWQASLFGSRARGQAREDSDIDILLIFCHLPPDREPHAGHAERIAKSVAEETRQPLSVWSVSLVDLDVGNRTPMLVDALSDSVLLWSRDERLLAPVTFTPVDAIRCAHSLLERVEEGSEEFAILISTGELGSASRRVRDDIVRLCTAYLLLRGWTRPRRGDAVSAFSKLAFTRRPPPPWLRGVLEWTRRSFGEDGRNEDRPVSPPQEGMSGAAEAVDFIRQLVIRSLVSLERTLSHGAGYSDGSGTNVARISGRDPERKYFNDLALPYD